VTGRRSIAVRATATAAVAVALTAGAACSGSKPSGSAPDAAPVPTTTEASIAGTSIGGPETAPEAASSTPPGAPRYAVGTTERTFVDTSRDRTLHTIIHYPAVGAAGSTGDQPAPGSFPLVLMAHGYQLPAGGYERLLDSVAAAGFVVAAPAFPHTSAEYGDGQRSDLVNQPADLSFVADEVIALSAQQPGPLPTIADPSRIGVMGHSDGGLTAAAWAYGDRFYDPRAAAVVDMAAGIGLLPGPFFGVQSPPLLIIHATADGTYPNSVSLFDSAPAGTPTYLLTIEGGSHLGPYMYDTPVPEVTQVVVDFLDAHLLGDDAALERLRADGDHPGVTSIRER